MTFFLKRIEDEYFGTLQFFVGRIRDEIRIRDITEIAYTKSKYRQMHVRHGERSEPNPFDNEFLFIDFY